MTKTKISMKRAKRKTLVVGSFLLFENIKFVQKNYVKAFPYKE